MIFPHRQLASIDEMLSGLRREGYHLRFRRETGCIYCFELDERVEPGDFIVDQSFYFESALNPDADRVLYAISLSTGERGFLVDLCNVYSDNISDEMEQKLQWQYPLFT